MQQFIPFEDDWDALEQLRPDALIPYRVGLVPVHTPMADRPGVVPAPVPGQSSAISGGKSAAY
ncbi:hypothetical protein [Dyella caseinilytica]|uniref:Uncharacterized protein n=1 Tax=Dyella caseinilytica TaxID=1849581 RepID=A0ABX7GW91_9GAMM|nr:hypothetical protein [Dyella caseinilytica]QRN54228.1 hypothetical protein ISN74_02180 [Dyella caseinilytica]GFZ92500.1 hypothetical protein GCM10011408_10130 [Dyella caseinilytica]